MLSWVRLSFAWLATIGWLGCLIFYIKEIKTIGVLLALEPNQLGDLLAGAFAPLAFFWFVIGYFQQGEELRSGNRALELQARELKISSEALTKQSKELEKVANFSEKQVEVVKRAANISARDSLLRSTEIVFPAMSENLIEMIEASGAANSAQCKELRSYHRNGDIYIYATYLQSYLTPFFQHKLELFQEKMPDNPMLAAMQAVMEEFISTNRRKFDNLIDQYMVHYTELLNMASQCDDVGTFRNILVRTPFGKISFYFSAHHEALTSGSTGRS